MAQEDSLDAHERPPAFIKNIYKFYQKLSKDTLNSDVGLVDLSLGLSLGNRNRIKEVDRLSRSRVCAACCQLQFEKTPTRGPSGPNVQVYEARDIPGKPRDNKS